MKRRDFSQACGSALAVSAIGLSASFVKPLEASTLALIELSATLLNNEMPATRTAMDIVAQRFNNTFSYR